MARKIETKLLRYDQVVAKLHALGMDDVNEKWVRNQADRGYIPFTRVGKFRRFREDVIDKMVDRWMRDAA